MKHFYFNGFPKPTSPNTLLTLTGHNEHKQTNLKSKTKRNEDGEGDGELRMELWRLCEDVVEQAVFKLASNRKDTEEWQQICLYLICMDKSIGKLDFYLLIYYDVLLKISLELPQFPIMWAP